MKRSDKKDADEDRKHEAFATEASDLKGDYTNVVILLFLYLLQGEFTKLLSKFCLVLKYFCLQEFH